ncbi:MAG TPA: exodeoxyribonuclease VII small subunit [Gemmatimonadales bacterium]|nr:exodeoxyribonuclease VII small subunit [Gemmatimonadales bacterium]
MTAPSFRDELERLESIVRSLERDDLDLDRALALFQEGVERLRSARALLERSELTVRRVLEAADGTLTTEPTDR